MSSQSYPLFDQLSQKIDQTQAIDIKRICNTINNISLTLPAEQASQHYREIAALILHYELTNNPNGLASTAVPFDGKLMAGGNGILYHINKLPIGLQHLIAQYIEYATQTHQ